MGVEDSVVNAEGGDSDVGDLSHDENDDDQARVQANLSTLMPSEGPEDQVPGGRSNGNGDLGQHGHHPSPDHRRMCLLLDVGGKQRDADGAIGELLGSAFSSNVGLVRGPSGLGESHVPRAEPKTYGFHVRNTCRQVLVHELERCCEELPHDTPGTRHSAAPSSGPKGQNIFNFLG